MHQDERAAQKRDAVEHHAAGDHRLRGRPGGTGVADAHVATAAPEAQAEAEIPRQALEHPQIEIDHVPAGENIRIELPHPFTEKGQETALGGERLGSRHRWIALGTEEEHLGDAATVERDREQTARLGICFDVEREQLQATVRRLGPGGGAQFRIVENATELATGA